MRVYGSRRGDEWGCRKSRALIKNGAALPTKTKVESGTSHSKSGISVNLSISGNLAPNVLLCSKSLDSGSMIQAWLRIRTTASQKCEAVPRRARNEGSYTCLPLNSRLKSNKAEEISCVEVASGEPLDLLWPPALKVGANRLVQTSQFVLDVSGIQQPAVQIWGPVKQDFFTLLHHTNFSNLFFGSQLPHKSVNLSCY